VADFQMLWGSACGEVKPDPKGAAGRLVAALADLLDVDQVAYEQIGDAALFLMDLSVLKFKGMDLNVIMVTHPPKSDDEEREQARLLEQYKIAVESFGVFLHKLLWSGEHRLNPHIPALLDAVVIYRDDLDRLFHSGYPTSALFGIIRRQRHIEQICPFNTDHEARGGMFKGRKEELRSLTQDMESNYLISSSRRIGKTSLARRAYDVLRVRPEYKGRVFYFNCISWGGFGDCGSRIAHQVDPRKELRIERGQRNISYLLEVQSSHGSKPLIFFFDEVDRVIDAEASRGWPFFTVLAEATRNRWARVVFIGYRSIQHLNTSANTDVGHVRAFANSPFYRSLTPLSLGPLNREEASSLITEPFEGVGMKIRSKQALSDHIWQNTRGHPFLIQFYGTRLFRRAASRTSQEVLPEDLEAVEESRELDEFMENHFLENTIDKGQPVNRERICAFLFAHYGAQEGWTQGDFVEKSHEVQHPLTLDEVKEALTNLTNATIFTYDCHKYSFTFPLMGRILKENYRNVSAILKALDLR
jgi:hypothetical protein